LPVVEGGKLVGIVSQGDVYQSIFKVHLHMQSDPQD